MKRKNFIIELRKFADNTKASHEIYRFISNYEIDQRRLVPKKIKKQIRKKFEKYDDYLQSDLWRSIRKRVFEQKGKICERCKATKKIHVHHSSYAPRVMDGSDISKLYVLCENCHKEVHRIQKRDKIPLSRATNVVMELKAELGFSEKTFDLPQDVKKLRLMKRSIK